MGLAVGAALEFDLPDEPDETDARVAWIDANAEIAIALAEEMKHPRPRTWWEGFAIGGEG